MRFYSHTKKELELAGIREGELALYSGTKNPRQPDSLDDNSRREKAYAYVWHNSEPQSLYPHFFRQTEGPEVFHIQDGAETYGFLRDAPSGYIRQLSGPAKPVVVANLGAIPLRVDTLLGKFTVYAGTILRLDGNAPRREKKTVLLTFSSQNAQPLTDAELYDGTGWRRLNIREEPFYDKGARCFTVLDGSAVVQYVEVNENQEPLFADPPEPDPDYEIYVTVEEDDRVTLRFNRSDYREGQIVQRKRSISGYGGYGWAGPDIFDLQKLRESPVDHDLKDYTAKLPDRPVWAARDGAETEPEDCAREDGAEIDPADCAREDGAEIEPEDCAREDDTDADREREGVPSPPAEPARVYQRAHELPAPEPPEDFPQ